MKLGDTFRWGTPPHIKARHLWFVISDPAADADGSFVAVNITQDEIRAGRECVLQSGDHLWITKESFVSFGDARLLTKTEGDNLASRFGTDVFPEAALDPKVIKRIIEAAKLSTAMAQDLKNCL